MRWTRWIALGLLAAAASASAQDSTLVPDSTGVVKPFRVLVWSELKARGAPIPGTILPPTMDRPFEALRVENKTGKPKTITVATLDEPGITRSRWLLSGHVHYEKVAGKGYLEMLNRLTDGGTYFSRTLSPGGPLGWLTGSSGWRPFALPFNALKRENRPTQIVVNVFLPQRGVVDLSPLELYQGDGESP